MIVDPHSLTSVHRRPRRRPRAPSGTARRLAYGPRGAEVVDLGYRSAAIARSMPSGVGPAGSGDSHLRYDRDTMRRQSQEFDRDNGLYHGIINRAMDCILGDGLVLQARTASDKVNQRLEALWAEWWEQAEVRGMDDGPDLERMIFRHLLVDGDVGVILDDASGQIQLIESERIYGGPSSDGVEIDRLGRPVAYYVSDYGPGGRIGGNARRIEADRFVYLANRHRQTQTRGVPVLQAAFAMFHRINDTCDSEAIAWQLQSKLAFAINRQDAERLAYLNSEAEADYSDETMAKRYTDIGEALIFNGVPGETVTPIERKIPGSTFTESLRTFLRLLGLPLGLPLELVLLDWSQTNYSSARASIKQAERMFRRWQRVLRQRLLGRIYRWKLDQWVSEGLLTTRRDLAVHDFLAPVYPFVDPQKETEAQLKRFAGGLTSPSREAKEAGLDLVDLLDDQERDLRQIADRARRFNAEYPEFATELADWTGFVREAGTPEPVAVTPEEPEGTSDGSNQT